MCSSLATSPLTLLIADLELLDNLISLLALNIVIAGSNSFRLELAEAGSQTEAKEGLGVL